MNITFKFATGTDVVIRGTGVGDPPIVLRGSIQAAAVDFHGAQTFLVLLNHDASQRWYDCQLIEPYI